MTSPRGSMLLSTCGKRVKSFGVVEEYLVISIIGREKAFTEICLVPDGNQELWM
jgi:hypothetical protein